MIHQPAVAEHGHEDRDLAGRGSDLDAAALAPVDLHRLGRLVVDFLIDATACGTDGPQVAADGDRAAGVAIGAASNFLADAHRREFGILGQQGVDLGLVRVQEAGAARSRGVREAAPTSSAAATVCQRAVESPGNRPAGEFLDLGQAANLGPQSRRSWRAPFLVGMCRRDGPAQDIAQLHQPSARLGPAALARAGQGKHLGEAELHGRSGRGPATRRGPGARPAGASAAGRPACRRRRTTARACRPRPTRKKYNSTASRERWSMCSRTKRRSTQDQPVAGGRRSRLGNQNAFGDHAWAPEGEQQDAQAKSASRRRRDN